MVRVLDHVATVALVMEIEAKLYGLTVHHLLEKSFPQDGVIEKQEGLSPSRDALDREKSQPGSMAFRFTRHMNRIHRIAARIGVLDNQDFNTDAELWEDDTLYDSPDEKSENPIIPSVSPTDPGKAADFSGIEFELSPAVAASESQRLLDYILIEITTTVLKKPNCFPTPNNPEKPQFFGLRPSTNAVDV